MVEMVNVVIPHALLTRIQADAVSPHEVSYFGNIFAMFLECVFI